MAERPPSKSSAEWRFDLGDESTTGIKPARSATRDIPVPSFDDVTEITGRSPGSVNYKADDDRTPTPGSIKGSVQMAAVSALGTVIPKLTNVIDIFNGLHPTVKRDLVRVSDLAHSPGEFNKLFREFCATNPLLLQQVSNMYYQREVKAKITVSGDPDSGWCILDELQHTLRTEGEIELWAQKTSGDFTQNAEGARKPIPLRNIIPHNLTR